MSLTLENLPPELFRYILTYLSPEETSALAQTSHQMKRVTRDDKIWQQYFLTRLFDSIKSQQPIQLVSTNRLNEKDTLKISSFNKSIDTFVYVLRSIGTFYT
ncbi:unnamed protein product [Adineta steineri]|uniref:F-box domain-containing protein n=2 Tax=Adineta steineri TaxID=433720 RepID=A0A814TBV3_9BILA|nr:unnamed protein product [Adineta steineri]